jgi:hypothetical protein
MPRTRLFVALARLLLGLALVPAPRAVLRAKEGSSADAKNGPLINVQIAGNDLRIPRDYFLPPDVPMIPKRNDIWIHALWPDMAPMREDNEERWIHIRGHGPLLNILVLDQSKTTSLDFRMEVVKILGEPYSREPDTLSHRTTQKNARSFMSTNLLRICLALSCAMLTAASLSRAARRISITRAYCCRSRMGNIFCRNGKQSSRRPKVYSIASPLMPNELDRSVGYSLQTSD